MSSNEWKEYKLGDFADVQNGYAFKSSDFADEGVPVIKIKNIANSQIEFNDVQYYSKPIDKKLNQFIITKDDILISMTGSHINQIASAVGRVGRYQYDSPALLNQRVGKVYIKDPIIADHNFLYYFLNRFETQFELASSAGGSANQANISPSQIKNLKLFLPPINEQKRISSILSSLDEKIELNRQTNETLEAIAQSIFKEWFVDFNLPGATSEMQDSELGEIPKGWRVGKLIEELNIVYGKNLPTSNLLDSGYPVFGGNGQIGFYSKYLYEKPQVVVACRGAASGKVNQSLPFSFVTNNSLVFEIRTQSTLNFPYLKFLCLNTDFTSFVSGSAQPQLTIESLKGISILVPDRSLLKKFDRVVSSVEDKVLNNNSENQTLTQMRNSLLPKLMKGEISIPN